MTANQIVETKVDTQEKLAAVAGKPTNNFLFAYEINEIVAEINKKQYQLKILLEKNESVGIHNDNPEYVLDVKNKPDEVIQLTGTFSYDPITSKVSGIGTLMLTETDVNNPLNIITVLSTGQEVRLDMVISNKEAYDFMGGDAFTDEVCVVTKVNKKLLNINDVFKVGEDADVYGEVAGRLDAHFVRTLNNIRDKITAGSYSSEINLSEGGYMLLRFMRANNYKIDMGYDIDPFSGMYRLTIKTVGGSNAISFFDNGSIGINGLTTTVPTKPDIIYKDANGFLKIS